MEKASHRGQEAGGPERGWQLSLSATMPHREASLGSDGKAGMCQKAPQGFSGLRPWPPLLLPWVVTAFPTKQCVGMRRPLGAALILEILSLRPRLWLGYGAEQDWGTRRGRADSVNLQECQRVTPPQWTWSCAVSL